MKPKLVNRLLIAVALGLMAVGYFVIKPSTKPLVTLPIMGPMVIDSAMVNGKYQRDTVYHTIANFSFTNQEDKTSTQQDLAGCIYVADYFFTHCKGICLKMSNQLMRVYAAYKDNPQVKVVSHTVDPERDSATVLQAYADQRGASITKWIFLTGNKKDLYDLARNSYLLDAHKGDGGAEDFIHTQNVALVDKQRRIRGYYDATDSTQVTKLIDDMKLLLLEQ